MPDVLKVLIRNFKSIDNLVLELGRVNLFIGENGCGKTNILEALGMAAAAASHNLSNAALRDRGIRVAEPLWMRSAFTQTDLSQPVEVGLAAPPVAAFIATLTHDNTPYGHWVNRPFDRHILDDVSAALNADMEPILEEMRAFPAGLLRQMAESQGLPALPASAKENPDAVKEWVLSAGMTFLASRLHLSKFLAYAPREDVLRDLARDSDVEPIGIHGEGLFKLLQVLESEGMLPAVKEQLALLGWFDDLSVSAGVSPSSRTLQIRDVFIDSETPFDQRSANEGFLFVLLYTCLLVSKHTPRFFAVDNVDTALNPKLCARTVQMFAELTKRYDRRVLLTAHNPGALDGIDLHDDDQRLFVIYRNTEGRTRARRVLPADLPAGTEPVRLSEAFLRGYLGALPTNF